MIIMIIINVENLTITLFKKHKEKNFILLYKICVDVNSSTTRKQVFFCWKITCIYNGKWNVFWTKMLIFVGNLMFKKVLMGL